MTDSCCLLSVLASLTSDQVSAAATVSGVVIAGVTAFFGYRQYRYATGVAELETTHRLLDKLNELTNNMESAFRTNDQGIIRARAVDFLEVAEIYAAAYLENNLPRATRDFVRYFLCYNLLEVLDKEPFFELLQQHPQRRETFQSIRQFAEHMGHRVGQATQ